MNNKSLIEQQDLVRYPNTMSDEYSDLHCTICYKRIGDDAWMLNSDNLPEDIRVQTKSARYIMPKEVFVSWYNEVRSFERSDRDIGDCQGNTLLEKIQEWFRYHSPEIKVEALCN